MTSRTVTNLGVASMEFSHYVVKAIKCYLYDLRFERLPLFIDSQNNLLMHRNSINI
jgi:hypothetical protein